MDAYLSSQQKMNKSKSAGNLNNKITVSSDVRAMMDRIKEQALRKKNSNEQSPVDVDSPMIVGSSEEESAMASSGQESTQKSPIHSAKFDLRTRSSQRLHRQIQKNVKQKFKLIKASGDVKDQSKIQQEANDDFTTQTAEQQLQLFESEYEFFLNYLWSQKGFQIEDNADEYNNLENLQSTHVLKSNPTSSQTAHRNSHLMKSQDPNFFRHEKQKYMSRVPISFNFKIPETLLIRKGGIQRWYYSDELGVIRLHNTVKRDWHRLVETKIEDNTTPALITYRNPIIPNNANKKNGDSQVQDNNTKKTCVQNSKIIKDNMSAQRTVNFIRNVTENRFPKDVHLVQEMHVSADLTPKAPNFVPNQQQLKNVSQFHEIFECQWTHRTQELKIFKIRNFINKSKVHIASSKEQITQQMKPIKFSHGTPNPSKAALMKLTLPQQMAHLSYEIDQNLVERVPLQLIPDNNEKMSKSGSMRQSSQNFRRPRRGSITSVASSFKQSMFASQQNYNSPIRKTPQELEQEAHTEMVKEIQLEARAALLLIHAQFMFHQMHIAQGSFYFQWVHNENETTRDPQKPLEKILYLIYLKDLVVLNKHKKRIKLPRRQIEYSKDMLTQHFYNLMFEHEDLRQNERNHTLKCKCEIQIDQQPLIKPLIASIYANLMSHRIHRGLKEIPQTVLSAFAYFLNCFEAVQMGKQKQIFQQKMKEKAKRDELRRNYVDNDENICFLCDQNLPFPDEWGNQRYTLPLIHLLYMPYQEQFLYSLGDSFPQTCKDRLLLTNKDIPVFLRLLIPEIKTVEEYRALQQDKHWVNQEVSLTKECYSALSRRIVFLAQQSERLDEVQTQFQEQMLKMIRNQNSRSTKVSRKNSKEEDKDSKDRRFTEPTIQNQTGSYSQDKSRQNQSSSKHNSMNTAAMSRKLSELISIPRESRQNSQSIDTLKDEHQEHFKYLLEMSHNSMVVGKNMSAKELAQQVSAKQAMDGKPITRFRVRTKSARRKEKEAREAANIVSESEDLEVKQLMDNLKEQEQTHNEIENEFRGIRLDQQITQNQRQNNGGKKVKFGSNKFTLNNNQIDSRRSSLNNQSNTFDVKGQLEIINKIKQDKLDALPQTFNRQKEIRKIVDLNKKQNLSRLQRNEEQNVLLQQMKQQEKVNETSKQSTQNIGQIESALRDQIQQPLFGGPVLPSIKSHRDIHNILSIDPSSRHHQSSQYLNQETESDRMVPMQRIRRKAGQTHGHLKGSSIFQEDQIRTEHTPKGRPNLNKTIANTKTLTKQQAKVKVKGGLKNQRASSHRNFQGQKESISRRKNNKIKEQGPDKDENIVAKLLEKHVPDFKIPKKHIKTAISSSEAAQEKKSTNDDYSVCLSEDEQNNSLLTAQQPETTFDEEILNSEVKKRRRALVKKFKKLKEEQNEKNITIMAQEQSRARLLSIREQKSLDPKTIAILDSIVGKDISQVSKATIVEIERQIPQMVSAQSLSRFEIARLTRDPIFGDINQAKIMNADNIIRQNRIKDDPQYNEAMKQFDKRIEDPVTKEEFELKKERKMVEECETLVGKMQTCLDKHQLMKPATLAQFREFTMTSRILVHKPVGKITRRSKSKQGVKSINLQPTFSGSVNEAQNAITMIEMLKKREQEIAIEEAQFKERRHLQQNNNKTQVQQLERVKFENHLDSSRVSNTDATSPLKGHFVIPTKLQQNSESSQKKVNKMLQQRTEDLITLEHRVNEQEVENQLTLDKSMATLEKIDRNITKFSKILGRSKTQHKLRPSQNQSQYYDNVGRKLQVGQGKDQVTAVNQRQANVVNLAKQHTLKGFKLRDLFNV